MHLPRCLRACPWLCLGLLSTGTTLTADEVPVSSEIWKLPTITVTNPLLLPPPEAWRYAKVPGIEVLTNASNHSTKRFLRNFQLLQQVIDVTWPGLRSAESALPTTLILYGRGEGARSFLTAKGQLVGDEVIEFQPSDLEETDEPMRRTRVASRFLGDEETACIVVDLQEDAGGFADPYRQFYGDYVRYLISRLDTPSPLWLKEGLARLYSGVDFNSKWITLNQVGSGAVGERQGDFNTLLGRAPLNRGGARTLNSRSGFVPTASSMPTRTSLGAFPSLAEMLQADGPVLNGRLRVLAHAFVHMCLYGRGQRYQKPLFDYLARTKGQPGSEEVFAECFGMSIKEMQSEIMAYAGFTDYKLIILKAKKGGGFVPPVPIELREATGAEIGRIKGQGLMLAGAMDAARLELVAPYVRGEHDADQIAALGLFELRQGRKERGRHFLEIAATRGTIRAGAWLELARLRHAELMALQRGAPLDEKQREAVLAPLRKAGGLPPPLLGVYELMALVWLESPANPKADDLAMLEQGAQRFYRRLGLVYQTAQLHAASGMSTEAARLADWGQKAAQSAQDKERFGQLLARVSVATAAAVK